MIYGRKHELLFQFEMPPLSPAPLHTLHSALHASATLLLIPQIFYTMYGFHKPKIVC